ncbi:MULTISPECIES: aldo/keto reductase [unclassified Clostridium]|uniref:aldo/keto reductase n=1 Tax=unclassified Clostridium TaxID=2614128 RepID=UPI0002973037|nr:MULTISPECIES: aldo/keto reductase [unclassified Clostridium]EKQ53637.1 MAG: aldo/keto reductase, diketogulonate reductase [Clostridium sp. Maddingley MBC34-26]
MKKVILNNGVEMPILGFGVFQLEDEKECEQCVYDAIVAGYRLIDTAAAYINEAAVGKAIERSGISREELFITTKLWVQDAGYDNTKKAFYTSLKNLHLDYLDLYLIHQPYNDYYGSWRAMEELYKEGKIRTIGVSNFNSGRLIDLILNNEVVPAINQVETHPFCQRIEEKIIMDEFNVQIESSRPFAAGQKDIFKNEILSAIGQKYNKTISQVILRWHIQRGVITIPKSAHKERIQENFNIWDFQLSEQDMALITSMDKKQGLVGNRDEPEFVKAMNRKKIHE